jgi:membrane protease YdiL (CAAX protease family)
MLSEKPWRFEAVLQLCAAQIACLCLGIAAIGLLHKLGVHGFLRDESFGSIVVGTLCFQGATWPLILFFLRQHGVGWRAAFGFRGPKLKRALLTAFGFIVVVLPVVLLLQAVSIHTLEKLGWPSDDQAAVKLLTDAKSVWTTIYLGVFAVVLAPVAEEFIFRGMLFPFFKQFRSPELVWLVRQCGLPRLAWFIRKRGWRLFAWFGVSFLFALIHMNAPTFVPLFVFALALTWLYERTDNLLAPITAHALFNATNLVLLHYEDQVNQLLEKLNYFLHLT